MSIWIKAIKKYLVLQLIVVVMLAGGLLFYASNHIGRRLQQAVSGAMNVSQGELATSVRLDGQWEFYWRQLLTPSDFQAGHMAKPQYIVVPSTWNNYRAGVSPQGDGYATYRLRIRLQEGQQFLAVKIANVATAYKLYINGKLVRSVGVVGRFKEESNPQYLPQIVDFYTERPEVELVMQVANFAHNKGGIKASLRLGSAETISKLQERQTGFEMFLLGTFIIMTVYHFGLYFFRRKDKPALYFGLFCLLIFIRAMVTGQLIILKLFPAIAWALLLKIEYLSYYLAVPVFDKFIYHVYAADKSPRITNYFTGVSLLFSGAVVLLPVKYFTATLLWYDAFTLVSFVYVGMVLTNAVKAKVEGVHFLALGVCLFLATVVNDMLYFNGWIDTAEMVPIGLFIFIFFQALVLSTRFARAYVTLEKVSAELAVSNDRISHILESIADGFFALDKEARFTYLNKAAERLWQWPQEELLGKSIWGVVAPAELPLLQQKYQSIREGKIPVHFEIFSKRLGLWFEISAYPLQEGLSVFFRDIQERKQTEKKIKEYNKMLQEQVRLLDLDPDYTVERNLEGNIVFWNHGAQLGYQWTKEEAVGQRAFQLLETEFPKPLAEINDELVQTGRWMGELIQRRRDGSKVVVRSCWLLKRGVNGQAIGVLEFNKDITEQKEMEAAMVRLDQLKLIGQMAAGISHEVRNPMTTTRGFLQLLSKKEENVQNREYYSIMISELDRANDILAEYLSIAKPRSANYRRQNVNEILLLVKPLLAAAAAKAGKKLVFKLQDVAEILLDDAEFRQLILNLCRNGLEAMADQGDTLTVTTFVQGEEVSVSVRDEGPGVSPDIVDKLGTPFLSTKDNGTGLGLAICYGIVARHKATLAVITGPEGTNFVVKFNKNTTMITINGMK